MPKAKQYEPDTKKPPQARQHKTHKIASLTSITRYWAQLLGMLFWTGRVVTKLGFTELDTFFFGTPTFNVINLWHAQNTLPMTTAVVKRASSVSLLHNAPFWMQIITADQLVFFVSPSRRE